MPPLLHTSAQFGGICDPESSCPQSVFGGLFLSFRCPICNIVQAGPHTCQVKQRTRRLLHLLVVVALRRLLCASLFQRQRVTGQPQLAFQEVMPFLEVGQLARGGVNGPIARLLLDLALVVLVGVAAPVAGQTGVTALV